MLYLFNFKNYAQAKIVLKNNCVNITGVLWVMGRGIVPK